jgi:uncharacterized protein YndB with AHSA1/START domain
MARFQQSATVNAAPDAVYVYLADFTKHAEWSSHGLTVEKASDGPVAVGSTFNTVGKLLGTHHAVVTVTELVPNERIGFESEDDTGHFRHQFDIAPRDGSSEVTKSFEPMRTSFVFTVLSPVLPLIVPRGLAADLKKIKERLET